MRLYNVHTLEETKEKIRKNIKKFETEIISIEDSLGRVLSEDVVSNIPVPSFRRSTVDGYAVISSETDGASETMPMLLKVKGEVAMGQKSEFEISGSETVYVPTGGMVPEGADAMVMIEYTEKFSEDMIAILKQALPFESIVKIGDDVKKDQVILKKSQKLSARHIGVLAATGHFEVNVYNKLKVTIISTGDELITADKELSDGEVFDINTYALKKMSVLLGLDVISTYVLKDDKQTIKNTISKSVGLSDITVISGGSSVGHKDYTADIIDELAGEGCGVMIHGLAIKPGKPTIVGFLDDKLVLGLPGHPVSAMIVYDQLIRMYLGEISSYEHHKVSGVLSKNIHAAPGKETFVMVTVEDDIVTPVLGKSGMITLMSRADGYIRINANDEGLEKGNKVTVYLLD